MRPTAFPMDMTGLDDAEQAMVDTVARWVDVEVRPRVREMEQAGDYPEAFIDQMKQMGMFGLAIIDPMVATAVSGR